LYAPPEAGGRAVHLGSLPEALRVDAGRLAPELPIPLTGLLEQVTPGDLLVVGPSELPDVDHLVNRLIGDQQPVVIGKTGDDRHHGFGDAESHFGDIRVAPDSQFLTTGPDHSAGSVGRFQGTDHLTMCEVGDLGCEVCADVCRTLGPVGRAAPRDDSETLVVHEVLCHGTPAPFDRHPRRRVPGSGR
jgi:hypothetical protein